LIRSANEIDLDMRRFMKRYIPGVDHDLSVGTVASCDKASAVTTDADAPRSIFSVDSCTSSLAKCPIRSTLNTRHATGLKHGRTRFYQPDSDMGKDVTQYVYSLFINETDCFMQDGADDGDFLRRDTQHEPGRTSFPLRHAFCTMDIDNNVFTCRL
jgi:hypothetical protein